MPARCAGRFVAQLPVMTGDPKLLDQPERGEHLRFGEENLREDFCRRKGSGSMGRNQIRLTRKMASATKRTRPDSENPFENTLQHAPREPSDGRVVNLENPKNFRLSGRASISFNPSGPPNAPPESMPYRPSHLHVCPVPNLSSRRKRGQPSDGPAGRDRSRQRADYFPESAPAALQTESKTGRIRRPGRDRRKNVRL